MIDSGIADLLDFGTNFDQQQADGVVGSDWIGDWGKKLASTFKLVVFQTYYRMNIIGYWLILSIPILLVSIISANYIRRIKQYNFGWSSLNKFYMSAFVVWNVTPLLITLYLVVPIAISPYWPMAIFLFVGWLIYSGVSNMQKIL